MKHARLLLIIVILIAFAEDGGGAQRIPQPRIPPLPPSQMTDAHRSALGRFYRGEETGNIFTTCVRNVELCRAWKPFADHLVAATNSVPAREKEMLILRTSWLCRADYDWSHHVVAAKNAGLSGDEILRITNGPDAQGWSKFDSAVLRAVDELHRDQHITDATWAALRERYTESQLMDAIFTVGQYTMVSMFLNSAGVQLEPGYSGLPK